MNHASLLAHETHSHILSLFWKTSLRIQMFRVSLSYAGTRIQYMRPVVVTILYYTIVLECTEWREGYGGRRKITI